MGCISQVRERLGLWTRVYSGRQHSWTELSRSLKIWISEESQHFSERSSHHDLSEEVYLVWWPIMTDACFTHSSRVFVHSALVTSYCIASYSFVPLRTTNYIPNTTNKNVLRQGNNKLNRNLYFSHHRNIGAYAIYDINAPYISSCLGWYSDDIFI